MGKVTDEMSGGTLSNQVIATGTLTLYGRLARWNTISVPNGNDGHSVASSRSGVSGTSPPVTLPVANQLLHRKCPDCRECGTLRHDWGSQIRL